ncbi:ATPase [Candidatus Woesebacteria bacterium RIFCSPHIGHO2_01_FULL_41_10]|uniref:ATPase n=1 Tax=Candidatus Woesebacteria bacterium RIFCSPHIGHO2_01_FULL_41_10 TaxID=1802500 RepID=A0A1F7YNM4_9BACT|nr:MAG: ATPase [Candidatus Woesebacteria bacterium RIFCSPHIGHO2_01_FULL_41_10]
MLKGIVARAQITVDAPISEVWNALISPDMIKKYMFGTDTVSDWTQGSHITWSGEWKGQKYEDKGKILKIENERLLQYTHFSALSGQLDTPENHHTVTIELSEKEGKTELMLTQDNCATEEVKKHSEENWKSMLESMKILLEE